MPQRAHGPRYLPRSRPQQSHSATPVDDIRTAQAAQLPLNSAEIPRRPRKPSAADTNQTVRFLLSTVCFLSLTVACGGRVQRDAPGAAGSAASTSIGGTTSSLGGVRGDGTSGGQAGHPSGGAATQGGEGGAAEAGAAGRGAEAGAGGAPAPTSLLPRTLTRVATEFEWQARYDVPDLIVTPAGRVFLETPYKIYEVEGSHANVYLTDVEAIAAVGLNDGYEFGGLDVDQHETLYATFSGRLIRMNAAHRVEPWRTAPGSAHLQAIRVRVLGVNDVLTLGKAGIWRVTAQTPATQLFSFPEAEDRYPYPEFALGRSGTFLFQPDSAQKILQRGYFDGSNIASVDTIYDGALAGGMATERSQFLCTAADPQGGFYVVVHDSVSRQLYHLTDDAHDLVGATRIEVAPSFADAATPNSRSFERCKLAAALDGTVYLQTAVELWQMVVRPE